MSNRDNPGVVRASEQNRHSRMLEQGRAPISRPGSPRSSSRFSQSDNSSPADPPSDEDAPVKIEEEPTPPSVLTGPGHAGDFHRDRSIPPLSSIDESTSARNNRKRVLVPATPSSPGLSYVTDCSLPAREKDETMDDIPELHCRSQRPTLMPSYGTPDPSAQQDDEQVGSVEHTDFIDIHPPTWGELRAGGDDLTRKFYADMYKHMFISNRTSIRCADSYEDLAKDNEELRSIIRVIRDEATVAHREVLRLSSGMEAMQRSVSSMAEEITLITLRVHESSPPQKIHSAQATRPPPNRPNLPPKPVPTQRIDDQQGPGNTPPAPSNQPPQPRLPTDEIPRSDDGLGGPSVSQIRAADAEMFDAEAYPEEPVPERGWNKVAGKGAKKNAKGTVQLKNATPIRPAPSPKPMTLDDSQLWILRFNGNPPSRRMTPAQMYMAVNSLDKGDWPFDVVTAHWSQNGNGNCVMLRFTARTTERAIDIHHAKILARLAHGIDGATLTRNVQWSKVVVMNVPCRKVRRALMDDVDPDADQPMHENEEIESYWTPADIDEQMRINPLYQRLHVTQKPDWTTSSDAMEGWTKGNVSFSFEDPHGELASDLFSRPMFLFNEKCPMRVWKERVHVSQCERCWKLGPSHADCKQRCKCCAKVGHLEEEHQAHCPFCEKEGWAANGKGCSHFSCANCNATHAADDGNCRARSEFVRIQRNRNNARYQRPSGGLGKAQGRR